MGEPRLSADERKSWQADRNQIRQTLLDTDLSEGWLLFFGLFALPWYLIQWP